MEILMYASGVVFVPISIFSVMFCIARGKGVSHGILILFASLLGAVLITCFGGQAILTHFDMGWRCTPFNTMLFLAAMLFIATLCFGMRELSVIKGSSSIEFGCGLISMLFAIVITLFSLFVYFHFFSWHDGFTTYNDQTIIYANDQHGGSCSWRYYNHINDLVHGAEITQYGWHGAPPRT